jgi:hypothetical protein
MTSKEPRDCYEKKTDAFKHDNSSKYYFMHEKSSKYYLKNAFLQEKNELNICMKTIRNVEA